MYFSRQTSSFSDFSSKLWSSATVISLLILGLFLIFLADIPNRKVEIVSFMLLAWGEHVMIRVVFELPPRDSCSTRVSLLSRQGTWVDLPSVRALITLPRAARLMLIFLASSRVLPSAPVLPILQLPAKSTRQSFPVLALRSSILFWLMVRMKSMWDLEDLSFILVVAIALVFFADSMSSQTSSGVEMQTSVKFSMQIPFFLSDLIFMSALLLSIRSLNFSMYSSTIDTLILNSTLAEHCEIDSNTCLTILGMIPLVSVSSLLIQPSMVWVFPEAVCPQAKMVPLNPSMTLSMTEAAAYVQTSFWAVSQPNIRSNEKVRGCSAVLFSLMATV